MTETDLLEILDRTWRDAEIRVLHGHGDGRAYPGPRAVLEFLRANPGVVAAFLREGRES